jgi:hypothetical protein
MLRSEAEEAQNSMGKHFNIHRLVLQLPGRPAKIAGILSANRGPTFSEVFWQRFFVSGAQSSFFTVNVPNQVRDLVRSRPKGHANIYRALIDEQLKAGNHEQDVGTQIYRSLVLKTEVLPWLEMSRWPRYFHGLNMANVAQLAYAANPVTEPALVVLEESFNRLFFGNAHQSILEDRISAFDQAQINSFIASRSGKHNL